VEDYKMKKIFAMAIALVVIGMTVAPLVQAQTAAQQRELEQIAKRSVNGLSVQDRQRVVQVMTDVYVAQGMSRQQAGTFAEMAADSMFTDYQEDTQSAEARRMIEAEEQRVQQQRQQEAQMTQQWEQQRRQQEQEERQREEQRRMYLGDTRGWPAAVWFRNKDAQLASLRQPAGTNASYDSDGGTVYLSGGNANTVMQDLVRQINTATGKSMTRNNDGSYSLITQRSGVMQWTIKVWQQEGSVRLSMGWIT
jgi:hypothetical protein